MVKDLYQKSFSVLMKRPFRLWGLSLLAGVLLLAAQVGFVGVPAVAFCAALLLDGMIDRMEEELGQKATVVATGGIAPFITPACKHPMAHADDLILRGLAVLYEQNK